MIPEEAVEAAVAARQRIVPTGDGTYEQRATWAGLEAAAPFIRAQALEDAVSELEAVGSWRSFKPLYAIEMLEGYTAALTEIKSRAVTERGGE